MSQYTVAISDAADLLPAGTESQILQIAETVIQYLDRYLDWQGTMDCRIDIKTHQQQVSEQGVTYDGWTPATGGSWVWSGNRWLKSNLTEATTGNDLNGSEPDIGLTIYLAQDGSIRIYGNPVWLDPDPHFLQATQIPSGTFDFYSVALHEFMHNIGFDGASTASGPFGSSLVNVNGTLYFQGPAVLALLGEAIPIDTSDHILASFAPYVGGGLMRSVGLYEQNRWDIGRIELAVLKDLGWDVTSDQDELPLADLNDSSPNVAGTGNSESLLGDFHANALQGLQGSDVLNGGAGNDTLTGGSGNDTLDGGSDADIAVFSGNLADYSLSRNGSTYIVQANTGSDGTDTLSNVESLTFADKTVNFTVQAKAAAAPQADVQRLIELYVAFFNRVPDADGLAYWIDQMSAGQSVTQVAETFYNAGVQYSSLTGFSAGMSNADFVNVVYRNVLGRSEGADAGGLAYWGEELASGRASHGSLVSTILDSAHTFKGDAAYGYVADLLDNKITVAQTFAVDWGLGYASADASISQGMAIAAAVTATSNAAALELIGVSATNINLA